MPRTKKQQVAEQVAADQAATVTEARQEAEAAVLAGAADRPEVVTPDPGPEPEKLSPNAARRAAMIADMSPLEAMVAMGDVGKIATTPDLRVRFIAQRCARLGIPPYPGAIMFMPTKEGLKPYHTAVCAAMVRESRGWTSKKIEDKVEDGVYEVWVRVYDPKNPEYFADNLGALPMNDSEGVPMAADVRADQKKKAFTQAERRATFSLAGLGGDDPKDDFNVGFYPEEPLQELQAIVPKPRVVAAVTAGAPAPAVEGQPAPAQPAPAPGKRRVVRKKDGTVVPQGPAVAAPAEAPAPEPSPEPVPSAVPDAPVEPEATPAVPEGASGAAPCLHPLLAGGKPGHTYVCPPPPDGCGQEVKIPGERQDPPAATATSPMPVRPKQAIRVVRRVVPR